MVSTTQADELKASALCKEHGLAPSYNPSAIEWTFLGANQPIDCGKPGNVRGRKHRRHQSSANWTMASSTNDSKKTEAIQFRKQELKRVDVESQLTKSIRESLIKILPKRPGKMEMFMMQPGLEKTIMGMKCEELPMVFSDSEDEEN